MKLLRRTPGGGALGRVMAWVLCCVVASTLSGQTLIEGFQSTGTPAGWVFSRDGAAQSTFTPLSGQQIGTTGTYGLQLSNNTTYTATAAQYTGTFEAAGASMYVQFDFQMFGGMNGTTAGHGGDGITFFLYDGAYANSGTFSPGGYGGSMGYAQRSGVDGLTGGYLGVGLDAYGNFSSASEGRVGGYNNTTGTVTESIGVRGPGSGVNGYAYLGGTGPNLGTGNSAITLDSGANPTSTNNTIQILLTATNQLTVTLAQGGTVPQTVLQMDLSGYSRPDTLSFGFTAGSGAATDNMFVSNLTATTVVASKWTNSSGNGNWGLNTNWNPSVVPTTGSDILLDDSTVTSAQIIDTGANRTLRSITFDAPFSYTLNNNTVTFDKGNVPGFSGIALTQTHGSANQTINSNLALNNDIYVRNNSSGTLTLNGALANGGRTTTFDGTGATVANGVISGTGNIVKNDTGTVSLSGANTYSGGTAINRGTVFANSNTALGTGAVTLSGGTLASSTNATLNNAITLQGNAGLSGLTHSGTLTQSGGDRTLTMTDATQSGAVSLSNTSTARTLTVQVDSGTSTISGAIGNGGTGSGSVTKTGSGNLVLSGTNTYTGTTRISDGTITLGGNDILANSSSLAIDASGTLNLAGFSDRVGSLTVLNGGATIDFGSTSSANTFVFGNYTPPSSGVLVINNFQTGTVVDTLGTTTANQSVGSVYFSGYGVATVDDFTTDLGTYGDAFLLRPGTVSGVVWDGSTSTAWTTNTNWEGNAAPGTSQIAIFDGTAIRNSVVLSSNRTVAGLKFDTDASSFTISGTRTLTLNGGLPYIQQKSANTQTISTRLALGANTVMDVTGAGNLVISGGISGAGNLVKDGLGDGRLILSGDNSNLTGDIYVNNGIVRAASATALGSATSTSVNVAQGATLELSSGVAAANAVTITGTGKANAGAIHNVAGANTLSGTIAQSGDTTIAADAATTLNLSGTLTGSNLTTTFSGAGAINVGTIATNGGEVVMNGTGTLTFNGGTANTYSGTTTVNSGTLALAKTAGVTSVAGNLVVNGGAVQLNTSNQIANTSSVTLNNAATLNLNNQSDTIAQITSSSADSTIALGTGSLTLAPVNNANSVFDGKLTGTGSLNLNGPGKVYLSGNSTAFSGAINVNGGTLNASGSNFALGTGTVNVATGANVQLQSGILTSASFNINGSGTTQNGAIQNIAGNNGISGTMTLQGSSLVMSDVGTLSFNAVGLGANALTVGGAGDTAIGGVISGTGSLVKNDSGILFLNGANTFTGAVTINEGTVRIATEGGLGSTTATKTITLGNATLHATGSFQANTAKTWTIAANSTGRLNIDAGQTVALTGANDLTSSSTSQLVKEGSGTLRIGGANSTYYGSTIVNAGTLELNSGNALGTNRPLTLSGGTLSLKGSSNVATTFSASVNVAADSTISTDRFSGTNQNYTHTLGSLAIGSNTLTTSGGNGYDLQISTAALNGASRFNVSTAGSDLTLGTVTGSGSLTKVGAGTLNLTGTSANTFSGGMNVNNGTVVLGKTAGVSATGTGALTIGDAGGSAALVQLAAANQISDTVAVTINSGGRLNLSGNNETLGSLSASSSTASVTLGAGTLAVGTSNTSTTFAGTISGSGGLTKVGSGKLTLTGTNTFTGGTHVAGGTLALGASNTLNPSSNLTISSGARVELGTGLSQVLAGLNTAATSTIDLGANSKLTVDTSSLTTLQGSLTGTGTLAFTGSGNVSLGSNLDFSTGTLEIGGTTLGGTPTKTLLLSGNVNIGTLNITGDTVLDFGNSAATSLNVGKFNIAAGAKVSVINWVEMTDYFIAQNFFLVDNGTSTPATPGERGSAPENQIEFDGYSPEDTNWTNWHEITPAPEPGTYGAIFMTGALACFGLHRWRGRRREAKNG